MHLPPDSDRATVTPATTPFLDTAVAIGGRLVRDALWDGDRCTWLGASMEFVERAWSVTTRAFGPDLYGGTAGIALFLGRLYRASGEPAFRRGALGALAQARSRGGSVTGPGSLGLYTGAPGVALAMATLAEPLDAPELRAEALTLGDALAGADPEAEGLDLLSGCAGTVVAALTLYTLEPRAPYLDLAVRCGERLLATAVGGDEGLSWPTMGAAQGPPYLTGFSHGAAGIAWALAELAATCGDDRYRRAAAAAVAYERAHFSRERGNWPDYRNASGGATPTPSYPVAWCHGAAGIGLARLRLWQLHGDPADLADARAALATTAASLEGALTSGGGNHSLCHGLAGNADLLVEAALRLGEAEHLELAETVGRVGIERVERPRLPWPCGVQGGGETPGLLLGLAGIGHAYLRLHDPVAVPSVLLPVPGESVAARPPAKGATR